MNSKQRRKQRRKVERECKGVLPPPPKFGPGFAMFLAVKERNRIERGEGA